MAYTYDAMGNPTGWEDTEEERKKREKELDNTPVHTQETTTYANGSQTHKTTTEIPAPVAQAQPVYQAPVPVARTLSPGEQVVPQPVAPAVPNQEQYNASIARQESGANPNIGYHNQAKSSAFGTYGITQGAYQDARKLNPNLPEDITQATPEQQNQAMNAFTAQNAKYLKAYGVEPTQQNLSAAHFLGAKGLADYLQNGTISPQAAAANGGEEKVRQIVNARLGGQVAPASGAANQPQAQQPVAAPVNPAQPQIQIDDNGNKIITNTDGTRTLLGPDNKPMIAGGQQPTDTAQYKARALAESLNDPAKAWEMYHNPDVYGKELSGMAGRQVADRLKQDMASANADKTVKDYFQAALGGDRTASTKLADIFTGRDKTEEGSYAKKFLTHLIFGADAAKRYGEDNLGEGAKWDTAEIPDGKGGTKHVSVKFSANGQALGGIDPMTRQPITGSELQSALAAGAAATKPAHMTPSVHGTPVVNANREIGLMMFDPKTNTNYVQVGKEKRSTQGWTTLPQNPTAVFNQNAAQEAGKGAGQGLTPTPVPGLPGVAGTGFGGQGVQQPPAGAGNAPAGNAGAPVAGAPVAGNAGAPQVGIAQQKQNIETGGKIAAEQGKSNIEYSNTLAKDRQNSQAQLATISQLQNQIDKNPQFWGIVSGTPSWNAFVNAQSNEDKQKSLSKLYTELQIPQDKQTEFNAVANAYRNLQVGTITSSGMSASQLNTEGESQRVIGQIGTQGDKPGAAKAALEFYKAKIEYNNAKASAWGKESKKDPNLTRLEFEDNFDATKGKEIFDKANEKINNILSSSTATKAGSANAPVAAPAGLTVGTEKGGYIYQGGDPADKNNWKKK